VSCAIASSASAVTAKPSGAGSPVLIGTHMPPASVVSKIPPPCPMRVPAESVLVAVGSMAIEKAAGKRPVLMLVHAPPPVVRSAPPLT
jgi:hypothetical protein